MGTDYLERIHDIGYCAVRVAKFGNDMLRNFDLPLQDYQAPFEQYGCLNTRETRRVSRLFQDLTPGTLNDVAGKYRSERLRIARSTIMKVEHGGDEMSCVI